MRRLLGRGAVVVLLGSLPLLTTARVAVWGDESRLWADAVAHSPQKPRPWINLGRQLVLRDAEDLAAVFYERALVLSQRPARFRLEGAMRAGDVARLNLAIYHANAGRYDKALALTAAIQPRLPPEPDLPHDHLRSPVERMERQWRDEVAHGRPAFSGF